MSIYRHKHQRYRGKHYLTLYEMISLQIVAQYTYTYQVLRFFSKFQETSCSENLNYLNIKLKRVSLGCFILTAYWLMVGPLDYNNDITNIIIDWNAHFAGTFLIDTSNVEDDRSSE